MTILGEAFVAVRPETAGFGEDTGGMLQRAISAIPAPLVFGALVGGAAAAATAIGEKFEDAYHTIEQRTGATGEALAGLEQNFKDVLSSAPGATFDNVAQSLSTIEIRTGLTGQALDDFTRKEIELGKVTNSDVGQNVQSTTALFGLFGVAVDQQSQKLDVLFKATQASGGSITDIESAMQSVAPRAQALGLSFDQTAALVANLTKLGLPASNAFAGLGIEFQKAAKAGKDPLSVIGDLIAQISKAPDATTGAQTAMDKFGLSSRQAFSLVAAAQSGALNFHDTLASLTSGTGGLDETAQSTLSLGDKLTLLKNKALVALEPIGMAAVSVANAIIDRIPDAVGVIADVFSGLWTVVSPVVDEVIGGVRAMISAFESPAEGLTSSGFAGALEQIGLTARGIFDSLVGTIQSFASDVASAVDDFLGGWDNANAKIGGTVGGWEAVFIRLGQLARGAFEGIIREVSNLVDFYGPRLLDIWHGLVDFWNSSVYPALHDKVLPVLQDIGTFIGEHLNIVLGGLAVGLGLLISPIGTIALGFVLLYEKSALFRGIVDDTANALGRAAGVLASFASMIVNNRVATVLAIGAITIAVSAFLPPLAAMAFGLGVAVGPFIAIGAAVAGLAAVFVYAYNNFDGFRTVVDAVVSAVSSQIAVFVSFFEERWDRISVAARNVFTAFKVAFDVFVDVMRVAFVAFVAVTIEPFLIAWNYFGDQIQAVIGLAVTTVQTILSTFMRVLGDVFDFVTSLLAGDWGGAWDAFKDIPAAAIDFILGIFGNLYNFVVDFFSTLPGNIVSALGDLGSLLIDKGAPLLVGFVTGVGQGLVAVLRFFAGLPLRIANGLGNAEEWLVNKGVDALKGMATGLGRGLLAVIDWATGFAPKLVGWLGDAGSWLVDEGPHVLWGLLLGFGRGELAVIDWAVHLPFRLLGWLGDAGSWLVNEGPHVLWGFLVGIGTGELAVIDWAKGLPAKVGGWIGDATTWLGDKGIDLIHGMISGMETAVVDILNWFVGLPDKIKNGIVSFGDLILGLGSDIVEGLIKGFDNAWHDILNWVKTKATDLVHLFTHPWEALSPSRVTMRLGQNIVDGMVIGLRNGYQDIEKAITDMPGPNLLPGGSGGNPVARFQAGGAFGRTGAAGGLAPLPGSANDPFARTNDLLGQILSKTGTNVAIVPPGQKAPPGAKICELRGMGEEQKVA